jgi:pimeloyl-ACP methyl ester carboxylesterase
VRLAYAERGRGAPVVLVHGMGTGAGAWAPVVEALAPAARVIVYDRRGYGTSVAPEGYGSTTVPEQGEDLAALVRALDAAPAVLGGIDFGALACLDVLLRHPELARAAVLVAPPLLALVPEATDALAAERIALEERLREGGPRAAMEAWLGHASDADPAAFFADYGGLASLPVSRRELRAIAQPVAVLAPSGAPPHVAAAAAALVRALHRGSWVEGDDPVAALRVALG